MGFNTGAAAGGAMSGAMAGAPWAVPTLGLSVLGGGLLGGLGGGFLGGDSPEAPDPMSIYYSLLRKLQPGYDQEAARWQTATKASLGQSLVSRGLTGTTMADTGGLQIASEGARQKTAWKNDLLKSAYGFAASQPIMQPSGSGFMDALGGLAGVGGNILGGSMANDQLKKLLLALHPPGAANVPSVGSWTPTIPPLSLN